MEGPTTEPITFESHKVQVSGPMATHELLTKMGIVGIVEVVEDGRRSPKGTWATPELFHDDCMRFVRAGEFERIGDAYYYKRRHAHP